MERERLEVDNKEAYKLDKENKGLKLVSKDC